MGFYRKSTGNQVNKYLEMNVLIIGSGGREHALAWKIKQSPLLKTLYIAPGNAGTGALGTNLSLDVNDYNTVRHSVIHNKIDMVVVGPEAPLVEGLHDLFLQDDDLKNVMVIGPVKAGAMLEGSKDFAKEFMQRHGIPTGQYKTFNPSEFDKAVNTLEEFSPPYVIKADGLAAGKGVLICQDRDEAVEALRAILVEERFGKAGSKVIIEEYLDGIECSVFVLTDGKTYSLLPSAKDYKRIGEGDTGPNTGGMGCISPVPFADAGFMKKVEDRIIRPTVKGLGEENIPYCGFIFFGLMNINGDPFVVEYNARMGDPEAEVVIPRIQSDLLELFVKASQGELDGRQPETDPRYAAAVMLVSGGYPGEYKKGKTIKGLDDITGSIVFHAGTKALPDQGEVVTSGGRVLAIASLGDTMQDALIRSYRNAEMVSFDNMYYRRDLGKDLEKYL
jgi:phosphoribosylamine--glycine ligase